MIISLAGRQGSGKTTVGKMLAEKLWFERFSTGDFMREMAMEKGMTLMELNTYSETDGGRVDAILDERQKKLGQEKDNFIIDARLAWHFIPRSFKVYLTVDDFIGASRIVWDSANPLRHSTDVHASIDEAIQTTKARRESESKRYMSLYQVDNHDLSHYDLVIDTTNTHPTDVVNKIMDALAQKWYIENESI
jgi:CMP/dCMP kinase